MWLLSSFQKHILSILESSDQILELLENLLWKTSFGDPGSLTSSPRSNAQSTEHGHSCKGWGESGSPGTPLNTNPKENAAPCQPELTGMLWSAWEKLPLTSQSSRRRWEGGSRGPDETEAAWQAGWDLGRVEREKICPLSLVLVDMFIIESTQPHYVVRWNVHS